MSDNCIFCKIVAGEIPSQKVYEDNEFLVFKDINPAAPVHLLLIPKEHIGKLGECTSKHENMLGRLLTLAPKIARDQGLDSFRFIINNGAEAGQTVFHLHAHILGGVRMAEKLL